MGLYINELYIKKTLHKKDYIIRQLYKKKILQTIVTLL